MDRLDIRFPPEWAPQKRTWLAWPHNRENWGSRPGIIDFYVELIHIIRQFQAVALLIHGEMRTTLPSALNRPASYPLALFDIPTDDVWVRDYGPVFVENNGRPQLVSFAFNAWGEKFPPFERDSAVPARLSESLGLPLLANRWIFEGGAIEVNGNGAGITTRSCLVGPKRNPDRLCATVERDIRTAFGLSSLLVLPCGLSGDHTDGHIDNVARFVARNHIVAADEADPDSPNHPVLKDIQARLSRWRPGGETVLVSTLPLPEQRRFEAETLPASYMNFIFVNNGLVVPLYQSPHDETAIAFFKKTFPMRKIIGLDCTLVIEEGGSLHCLTKQEPIL